MEVIASTLIFIGWSLGACVSAWLAVYGARMVNSSQDAEFHFSAKRDELQLNARFKAGLALAVLGAVCLVLLIYLYWKVVYALAITSLALSYKRGADETGTDVDNSPRD